jgi:hypothetical protein
MRSAIKAKEEELRDCKFPELQTRFNMAKERLQETHDLYRLFMFPGDGKLALEPVGEQSELRWSPPDARFRDSDNYDSSYILGKSIIENNYGGRAIMKPRPVDPRVPFDGIHEEILILLSVVKTLEADTPQVKRAATARIEALVERVEQIMAPPQPEIEDFNNIDPL